MEIATTEQDKFLGIIRDRPEMLYVDLLDIISKECIKLANYLVDEIENNSIQPLHPDYKIQYLVSLKHRLLSILDLNYKLDEKRIVNNCKTYFKQHDNFDDKFDADEWRKIISIGKKHVDYTGCETGEKAIQTYSTRSLSLPRISLPGLAPSANDVLRVLQKLIDDDVITIFQNHIYQLPNNAFITDPELNGCLQTILQYQLSERKSSIVWRLIGQIAIKIESLSDGSGLKAIFVNKDDIEKILPILIRAKVLNTNYNWLGTPKRNNLDKIPATSVYALIQTLFSKGYLKQPDERSTRKAFITFFGMGIKENTYSRISDVPMFHNDYLAYFQKLIPEPINL